MAANKSLGWKIVNSWWILLTLTFFTNWMAFWYIGVKARHKKWLLWAVLYTLSVVLMIVSLESKPEEQSDKQKIEAVADEKRAEDDWGHYETLFSITMFVWLGSIIHGILIRKEFLSRLSHVDDTFGFTQMNEAGISHANLTENDYKMYLLIIDDLRGSILKQMKKSEQGEDLIIDIRETLDDYIEQSKKIIEQDKKLKMILMSGSPTKTEQRLAEMKQRKKQTENPELINEYESTISKLEKQQKSMQNLKDQREMIRLKLDGFVASLKQMKLDLIKLSDLHTSEQSERIAKELGEKSRDLSNYTDALSQAYDDLDLT